MRRECHLVLTEDFPVNGRLVSCIPDCAGGRLTSVAQIPLNVAGGEAAILRARMPDGDISRLIRLAARRRLSRSEMARRALRLGLDAIERDGRGPPAEGG
jgi:hypothetical protein